MRKYGIIGDSDAIKSVFRIIEQVADTDVAVLIQGESGTGKELVARAVHSDSRRNKGDLVAVNCGAIPEGLLESELFGHEKGSFTGAVNQRIGYFEMANDGTIFLDEIGEMSLLTQVKLLRVLEVGEFLRVGGTKNISSNARVIAATNKDLEKEVEYGNFRQDLFYRLKSVIIELPPLRERGDDIFLLIEFFTAELEKKYSFTQMGFTDDALESLSRYHWPGNIRELKNMLESIILMKKGAVIDLTDLPHDLQTSTSRIGGLPVAVNKAPDQAERELIYGALLGLRSDIGELKDLLIESLGNSRSREEYRYTDTYRDISEYVPVDEEKFGELSVEKAEADNIKEALKRYNGNRRLAAKALGISERTLYRKIKGLGLA